MAKYDWLPTESAHENYPMEIVRGDFIYQDGSSIDIPYGKVVNDGWGQFVSTDIVGEVLKPLPVKMNISWFSYTEDKFYSGTFKMPYEKISNLFSIGLDSRHHGKKITYDQIMVGLAPEGNISVWLDAEGVILEVAVFKAMEADIEWKKVLNNDSISRKEYIDRILNRFLKKEQLAELTKNGIPDKLFEKYGKQYSWDLSIVGVSPIEMWLKTYNGEREFFNFAKAENGRSDRSVPKKIILSWHDKWGGKFETNIEFDEWEIFKAYDKFFSYKTDNKIKLRVEIDEMTHAIRISLVDLKFILQLEKCTVKMFSI
jgi:hypothetical protein